MKKLIFLCVFSCVCSSLLAQATDLVIDNQTPGWLSSKINYSDQLTVKNLKITGYINDADLQFIATLLGYNLNGTLDMGDVNIIGDSWDGVFNTSSKVYEPEYSLYKLILPKSLISYGELSYTYRTKIEHLVFDTKVNKIDRGMFYRKFNHLVIGDNVETISERGLEDSGYQTCVQSIHFPTTLKYIGDYALNAVLNDMSLSNVSIFPNLEFIGYLAFVNTINTKVSNKETLPDTLRFPKIKEFHISAFDYKDGMHVYLGDNVEHIYYYPKKARTEQWYPSLTNVTFHIAAITPPATGHRVPSYWNEGVTVYVPKEAVDNYKEHSGWKYANIIAESVPLEAIELNEHEVILEINETHQLLAVPIPVNADNATILWQSDNEHIAIVNDKGCVTAISSGEVNIIAKSSDGTIRDVCKVIVKTHPEEIFLHTTSVNIANIGETYQLEETVLPASTTDKSVTWKSSNEQVCTVSSTGLVTAIGSGTAVITVTTVDGGLTATCVVKVNQHVNDLTLNKSALSLKVGESEQLQATISPSNADNKNVLWTSANELLAIVDKDGNVNALKAGDVIITATSEDNPSIQANCKITIIQPVTGIEISQTSYRFEEIGKSIKLEVTVLPLDATNKNVRWSSSNESVCVVSNGNVITVGYGTSVIIATTEDGGFMAYCAISVEHSTGISEITNNMDEAYPIYNMMGHKVENVTKGQMYIRKGRKFVAR
ncbi:MAG: Ig-like domain-containing protein [Prevotella sp.]|nr:Ig-like domain-containing protein [Prevotella sp.]